MGAALLGGTAAAAGWRKQSSIDGGSSVSGDVGSGGGGSERDRSVLVASLGTSLCLWAFGIWLLVLTAGADDADAKG